MMVMGLNILHLCTQCWTLCNYVNADNNINFMKKNFYINMSKIEMNNLVFLKNDG